MSKVRLGIVVKNGEPNCGRPSYYGGGSVGRNTIKIRALPQAKAYAKKIGGVAYEVTKIETVSEYGEKMNLVLGADFGVSKYK